VRHSGIEFVKAGEVEWPQGNSDNPDEYTEGEKDPKGLLITELEIGRSRCG
jgi:hypothetical protein